MRKLKVSHFFDEVEEINLIFDIIVIHVSRQSITDVLITD